MQIDFRQFSRNNTYVSISGKLSEIDLHAWWFSNPCAKVIIIVGISWSPDLRVQHKQRFKLTYNSSLYEGSFGHVKVIANPFSLKFNVPTDFLQNCDL